MPRSRLPLALAFTATAVLSMTSMMFAQAPAPGGGATPPAPTAGGAATTVEAPVKLPPLAEKTLKAFTDLQGYQTSVDFKITRKQGRTTNISSMDIKIALDRASNRLLVDTPDFLLVSDGKKLRLRLHQMVDRYLEVPAPSPLTYENLVQAVPPLGQSPVPVLVILLAKDPFKMLAGMEQVAMKELPADPNDAAKRLRLSMASPQSGQWTFFIDPATSLINKASLNINVAAMGGNQEDALSVLFENNPQVANPKFDDKSFVFDTAKSQPVKSLQALLQPPHPLIGKPAATVQLKSLDGKEVNLANEKSKVVIIDFWATWCAPCRESLPKIQSLAKWAADNKKSVAVYTINIREKNEEAAAFVKENKLTLPVLMDTEGKVAEKFEVQSIPQTVLVVDGKVAEVFVGASPALEDEIKARIEELLAAPAAPAPATPAADKK